MGMKWEQELESKKELEMKRAHGSLTTQVLSATVHHAKEVQPPGMSREGGLYPKKYVR